MLDDLTKKEKGFADDFDIDLESNNGNFDLIVKHNFYVSSGLTNDFVFIPTGSSIKFLKCTSSSIPYYELKTYVIYLELLGKEIIVRGSQVINNNTNLVLRNCTNKTKDNKPHLSLNDTLEWDDIFVQSFRSIIKV